MSSKRFLRNQRRRTSSTDDGFPADHAEFVTLAYRYLLRREPDRSGLEHYLNRLNGGGDRATVLRDLTESPEFADLTDKVGVAWAIEPSTGYLVVRRGGPSRPS